MSSETLPRGATPRRNSPSISVTNTIPDIKKGTVIIGACGIPAETGAILSGDIYFLYDFCAFNLILKGHAKRQTWISAVSEAQLVAFIEANPGMPLEQDLFERRRDQLTRFSVCEPSGLVPKLRAEINAACELAKQSYPPAPILLLLFGHGSSSLGIYLDYSKPVYNPASVLTTQSLLSTMDPTTRVKLMTPSFFQPGWPTCRELDKAILKTVALATPLQLTNRVMERSYGEATVKIPSPGMGLLRRSMQFNAVMLTGTCPGDWDTSPSSRVVETRLINYGHGRLSVEHGIVYYVRGRWTGRAREHWLVPLMRYRLQLAEFVDGVVGRFQLTRPSGKTCLHFDHQTYLKSPVERADRHRMFWDVFMCLRKEGLIWKESPTEGSGFRRAYTYLWAAVFESELDRGTMESTVKEIGELFRQGEREAWGRLERDFCEGFAVCGRDAAVS